MEVKKGYKQTGVGIIPNDWEVLKLKAIANVKTGPFGSSLHESDYVDNGTPIITVEHLGDSTITHQNLPKVSDTDKKRLKAYELLTDDIVFSRVGSVDRNSIITENETGWLFSGRLLRIRITSKRVFPKYLSYHFHHEPTKQRIRTVAVGQTMASLNTKILNEIEVVIPPTQLEQSAIATVLSETDKLIGSLEKLISKKEGVKKGTMQALLTGKKRLPGFDKKWNRTDIKTVAEIISGGTPQTNVPEYWNGHINWCTPTDITSCAGKYLTNTERTITHLGLQNSSSVLLPQGTLLLCSRATIGEIKIAKNIICTNQGFKSLICSKDLCNEYFYYYIQTIKHLLIEKAIGSTFLEISKKDLGAITILLPELEEQEAIAKVLSDMDTEIEELKNKFTKYKYLKKGLMQNLLTGKIRVA